MDQLFRWDSLIWVKMFEMANPFWLLFVFSIIFINNNEEGVSVGLFHWLIWSETAENWYFFLKGHYQKVPVYVLFD